jgi:hypothetical protein
MTRGVLTWALVGLAACDPAPVPLPAPSAARSPIPEPARAAAEPLKPEARAAALAESARAAASGAESTPPIPFDAVGALAPDDLASLRGELAGVTVKALWRWRELPAAVRTPRSSARGLDAARALTALRWTIDVAAVGRLRAVIDSRSFALPEGSELLARDDRYGALVLWPDAQRYRVVPAGGLHATLADGRVDVIPLAPAHPHPRGRGKRLELETRKIELASEVGRVELELAMVPEAARGSLAFCRLLIEIAGVDPAASDCAPGELPVAASYVWATGAGVGFEVLELTRRIDLPTGRLLVPPPAAARASSGLPSARAILAAEEMAALRTEPDPESARRAAEARAARQAPVLPAASASAATAEPPPEEGLLAANRSDRRLYLLIDGVPVAAASPWTELHLRSLAAGTYSLQWRSFFGDLVSSATEQAVPGRTTLGAPSNGGPPP